MQKARIALAGILAGAAVVAAAPSASAQYEYVKVTNENGVITVTTQIPGQPLLGASIDTNTGRVCVGFSYQRPFCRTLPLDAISIQDPFGGHPPVVVDADASDGSIGVGTQLPGQPLLSARYYLENSRICLGFSYEVPFCEQVGPIN